MPFSLRTTITRFFPVIAVGILLAAALPVEAVEYVGSEACAPCHPSQFSDWQSSGHPLHLRQADKARHANLPLPPGYNWKDLAYVVGGINNKALFVSRDGYLVTAAKDGRPAKTLYNLQDRSWSDYHPGERKKYDCAVCHTTGYNPDGQQGGLPGVVGRWFEDGIGCEACHGAGGEHARNPVKLIGKQGRQKDVCGTCHQHGGLSPLLSASLVRHHEQLNELKSGAHKGLYCTNCHNPHQAANRARYNCINCHRKVADSYENSVHDRSGLKCFVCHMPRAGRTAISRASYNGEVRTHLFRINVDPEAEMFTTIEEQGVSSIFSKGYVTLDIACLGCHASHDRAWAAEFARGFHK